MTVEEKLEELAQKISILEGVCYEKAAKADKAAADMSKARSRYQCCIHDGDKAGSDLALSDIASAKLVQNQAINELSAMREAVAECRQSLPELKELVFHLVLEAGKEIEQARKRLTVAEVKKGRYLAICGCLNGVSVQIENLLTKAKTEENVNLN